jgi:hypothetical protein
MSRPGVGCRLTAEEHELRAAYRSRSGADQGGSVGRRVQTTAKPVRRRSMTGSDSLAQHDHCKVLIGVLSGDGVDERVTVNHPHEDGSRW